MRGSAGGLWQRRARAHYARRDGRVSVWWGVITRKILRTGEDLPAIGMGTWQTFDVGPREQGPRVEVVTRFFAAGRRLIDSSTPFESGGLFRRVEGTQLPPWAVEHGIGILGHPAVTCPIPATSSPAHIADNVSAGQGPLPDAKLRGKMREALEAS
jgi:diketogulonate reductase-like aldo/keto reductase